MKVACILDEFSFNCFKYEADFYYLEKENWQEQLVNLKPELLFVESFWSGVKNDWTSEIVNLQFKKNSVIKKVVSYCKKNNIKTIFWNKEDPVNFDIFFEATKLFDYIFTTDENCVEKYKSKLMHDNVWTLSFAAQPEIHNPIGVKYHSDFNVVFAGSWYPNYFLRQEEMKFLIDGASKYNLNIYDRNFEDTKRSFPFKYHKFVKGSLSYKEILPVYKNSSVFLNVNTVTNSLNMFSRRVYEILACSRLVISSYSKGVEDKFFEFVKLSDNAEEIDVYLSNIQDNIALRRSIGVNAMHEIYGNHLYEHRWDKILSKVYSNKIKNKEYKINIFTMCDNLKESNYLYSQYKKQDFRNKKLYIITNNQTVKNYFSKYIDVECLPKNNLNFCEFDKNDYFTLMFKEYSYDEKYLSDLYIGTKYSKTNIVTKCSYFKYFNNNLKIVNLENENMELPITSINLKSFLCSFQEVSVPNLLIINILEGQYVDILSYFSSDRVTSLNSLFLTEGTNCYKEKDYIINKKNINIEDYYNSLKEAASKYSKMYKGINNIINEKVTNKNKKIFIYGAGEHTIKLLRIVKNKFRYEGIIDKNPNLTDSFIDGLKIFSLDKLSLKEVSNSYFLISSFEYEEEIYDFLLSRKIDVNNIITLYRDSPEFTEDIHKELYSDFKFQG